MYPFIILTTCLLKDKIKVNSNEMKIIVAQ